MNKEWQQASTLASQKEMELQPLTPDKNHARFLKLRSNEYKRLMAQARSDAKEQRRPKSEAEQKAITDEQAATEAHRRRVMNVQHKAETALQTIRETSAAELSGIDDQLCETLPMILAGLESPDAETALLMERMKVEARQHVALMLNDRARLSKALNGIAKAITDAPEPLGRI